MSVVTVESRRGHHIALDMDIGNCELPEVCTGN